MIFRSIPVLLFLIVTASNIFSQVSSGVTLTASEILERIDDQMRFPDGLNKVQLTIMTSKGRVRTFKATLFQKEDNSLFIFNTIGRGRTLKILYNDQGQNIYAYNIFDHRLYYKREKNQFDLVLNSGFSFIDISNAPFSDNYIPQIYGKEKNQDKFYTKIISLPLNRDSVYGKVNFLVNPRNNHSLHRIDYYDRNGVLLKSLRVRYSKLSIKLSKKKLTTKTYPTRLEMAHMGRDTVSIMQFFANDKTAKPDSSLFKKENIDK